MLNLRLPAKRYYCGRRLPRTTACKDFFKPPCPHPLHPPVMAFRSSFSAVSVRCRIYVEDPAPGAELKIGAYTLTKLKRCFTVLKEMIISLGKPSSGDQAKAPGDERHVVDEREASRTSGCREGAHGEGADEGEVGEQPRKVPPLFCRVFFDRYMI